MFVTTNYIGSLSGSLTLPFTHDAAKIEEAFLVSGRDKEPSEHEPAVGVTGWIMIAALLLIVLAGSLGWMIV